jgi:hypothetical protein
VNNNGSTLRSLEVARDVEDAELYFDSLPVIKAMASKCKSLIRLSLTSRERQPFANDDASRIEHCSTK